MRTERPPRQQPILGGHGFTLPPDLSFLTLPLRAGGKVSRFLSHIFSIYCVNKFGLTDDEIKYVWEEYSDIITEKIENEE